MPDMLVNLLDLPSPAPLLERLERDGVRVHRPLTVNRGKVLDWVLDHSGPNGAGECSVCFARTPVSCFIASREGEVIGYACYDATAPDFFGPTRVAQEEQGKGIGKALLLSALTALREEGYVYAVIGGVGPVEFYEKCVGAFVIPNSTPGIYRDILKKPGS